MSDGGSSSNKTEKTTEITEKTTTKLGDVGLTGDDFAGVSRDILENTKEIAETQSQEAIESQRVRANTLNNLIAETSDTLEKVGAQTTGAITSVAQFADEETQPTDKQTTDIPEIIEAAAPFATIAAGFIGLEIFSNG